MKDKTPNSRPKSDAPSRQPRTGRILVVLLLLALGMALLAYGLLFHYKDVLPKDPDDSAAVVASEPLLIKEVTVGGLQLDISGQIRKTYTGQPPKACPT